MLKIISTAALAVIMAGPAWATDPHTPTPAPQPTNINQNTNGNWNANQNKQLQFQGQFQGQGQKQSAIGGGGTGGSANNVNSNTANNGNPSATINNTVPGSTFANVHSYSDGNPWANPAASAVAPSVYAASICQSAISGAAQTPLFGISFGSVQGLDVCIKLMLAEQARTEGRNDVAAFFKCQTKEYREAYKATGTPCPQDMPKQVASAAPMPAPQQTMQFASRSECIASLNAAGQATPSAVAACPQ